MILAAAVHVESEWVRARAVDFYGSEGVIGRYWQLPSWNGLRVVSMNINHIVSGGTISRIAMGFPGQNSARAICL